MSSTDRPGARSPGDSPAPRNDRAQADNHQDDTQADDDLEQRPDDDDYDLLTFGEAGARLVEEVRRQQRRIQQLTASGADDATLEKANTRLAMLEAAQIRNRKPSIDDLRSSGFFGPRP